MQDDQFYQDKFQNFQNSNSEQTAFPDMTFMQQPGETGRPPRRDENQREDRGPGRGNQPQFAPPFTPSRPPGTPQRPPFTPPRPPVTPPRPPVTPPRPPVTPPRPPVTPPGPPVTPPRPIPPTGGQPQPPRSAPPTFSPRIPSSQTGPRGLRNCLFRNTFIWLNNGNSFWFFPTFVGRQAVLGFRWRGFAWTFERINLNRIWAFQCF